MPPPSPPGTELSRMVLAITASVPPALQMPPPKPKLKFWLPATTQLLTVRVPEELRMPPPNVSCPWIRPLVTVMGAARRWVAPAQNRARHNRAVRAERGPLLFWLSLMFMFCFLLIVCLSDPPEKLLVLRAGFLVRTGLDEEGVHSFPLFLFVCLL